MKTVLISCCYALFLAGCASNVHLPSAEVLRTTPQEIVYKTVDTTQLALTFYYPKTFDTHTDYPSIIFFFGGGWKNGTTAQFEPHARYFASRGIVSVLADYRVESRNKTTPFDAVEDAKSAIRFLRKHSKKLYINPDKIVAAGGSAGGHLAAVTGTIVDLEEKISSKPNALVLFNAVFDNGPKCYSYDRIGERYPEISPLHNISAGTPPTIVFLGTEDALIPVETAKDYQQKMEAVGSRCDLFLYEGQKHGFFNFRNLAFYNKTVYEADKFLISLGYLRGEPTIEMD